MLNRKNFLVLNIVCFDEIESFDESTMFFYIIVQTN